MPDLDMTFEPAFERALQYFRAQDGYAMTPLHRLEHAGRPLLAKDETRRMGLGSFKALGGPYAVARHLAARWQAETGETIDATRLRDDDLAAFASRIRFVCASAGNHGLGVASGARSLGARARIFIAANVPEAFAARLADCGAEVVRAGDNYTESVAAAIKAAEACRDVLLADGSWPGYTELPALVMEGYTVIAEESRTQLADAALWPTHVFLQAGVGGLACAMAHMIRHNWPKQPELIVVESDAAPCLQASHAAGTPTDVTGPDSSMGRLDCKEPSHLAWHTLERCGVRYVTVSDAEAEQGALALNALGVTTTASGAAGFAALTRHGDALGVGAEAVPMVIISEGPT